jgi:soluble lytic murein transglycosylase-like protein
MTPKTPYTDLIQRVATTYGLPADVLEGQVLAESHGDPNALRFEKGFFERYVFEHAAAKAGRYGPFAACSVGLLQIMVEVAYEDGFDGRPEDLFEPRVGLAWGAKHLRHLLDWAGGDIVQALCAFNGGKKGNVTRPFRNQSYADTVMRLAGRTV